MASATDSVKLTISNFDIIPSPTPPPGKPFTCIDCNVTCYDAYSFNQHVNGGRHVTNFLNKRNFNNPEPTSVLFCEPCGVYCLDRASRRSHLNGIKHEKILARQKAESELIAILDAEGMVKRRCAACFFVTDSAQLLNAHMQSKEHKKRGEKLRIFRRKMNSVKNAAVKNINPPVQKSIVRTVVDFGTVDSKSNMSTFKRSITVTNASTFQVSIVSVVSVPTQSPFSTDVKVPITIAPAKSLSFNFVFNKTKNAASYYIGNTSINCVATVGGRSSNRSISFVKGISCTATLGDAALLETLTPVRKFSNLKQKPDKFRDRDVIPGIRPPTLSEIPYKHQLGKNEPTKELVNILHLPFSQQAKMAPFKGLKLSSNNYAEFFSVLLHAEEYQMKEDIRAFDLEGVTLERSKNGGAFFLEVPGLAEKRPSVLYGDKVLLIASGDPKSKCWTGYAHEILESKVCLHFDKGFMSRWIKGSKWDVRFSFSRTPFKRMHDAVKRVCDRNKALNEKWVPRMFPVRPIEEDRAKKERLINDTLKSLNLKDSQIEDNVEQCRAVSMILSGVHGNIPFVVFGPPGTGKTSTVIEAIYQLIRQRSQTGKYIRILATAPSNAAADLICSRLSPYFGPTEMIRFNAPSRTIPLAYPVEKYCRFTKLPNSQKMVFNVPPLEEVEKFKIIVSTCGASGVLYAIDGKSLNFTHVFVDEAGHAVEPEVFQAMQMLGSNVDGDGQDGRVILSGDPRQLGPIIHSPLAKRFGYDMSFLERIVMTADSVPNSRGCYSVADDTATFSDFYGVLLRNNYRSHQSILTMPNRLFYRNQLYAAADSRETESLLDHPVLPSKKFPILFEQVSGKDEREGNSPSWFNSLEVQAVIKLIETLLDHRGSLKIMPRDIGVIAPYQKQMKKITSALTTLRKKRPDLTHDPTDVTVGTTEFFQGSERRVIIVSTVRANKEMITSDQKHSLGFIGDPKRLNVAITRAKALLCVVGDAKVLRTDPYWRKWLQYVKENGGWLGEPVDVMADAVEKLTKEMNSMNVKDTEDSEDAEDFEDVEDESDSDSESEGSNDSIVFVASDESKLDGSWAPEDIVLVNKDLEWTERE